VSDNGSADWVALGAKGNDTGGQASLGFTSSGFGDANYTITGNGDGYVFVQSYGPGQTLLGGGGNLVLTTGNQGTTKDIIFGTGGFLSSNIFGRISHANNSFELSRAGATIKFPDSTVQNTAWTGNIARIANGNSNVNIATSNGNVTIAAVGNTTMMITGTGANVTGTLNVTGNANVANIGATNGVFTGNISGNTNGFSIGYLNIPQVAASNATLGLTDAGKHYYSTSAGNFTLSIPLNSSVAFATGTAISIVVQSAGNVLVNAISGVTLYMAGNSTAANRVVSNYGMATIMKVATDTWMINGTGVA
jgi:hypothetical protein